MARDRSEKATYPNLNRKIRESGKRKTDLAEEIGIPVTTFYDKLAGRSEIGIELAKKIKAALQVDDSLDELFGTEESWFDSAPADEQKEKNAFDRVARMRCLLKICESELEAIQAEWKIAEKGGA